MIDGITTSIAKHDFKLENVEIYPNPSIDNINVRFEDRMNGPVNYTIINLLGSEIIRGNVVSNQGEIYIDHNLMHGIYFIELETSHGSITKRFMVQ